MPANLPPQFHVLTIKLKEAKNADEKISILEEMLAICPKHKGTEKLQKDIKIKIAKLKKQVPKKTKGEALYCIQKEGAGQVVIVGPPNSGKSSLLNILTNAKAEVAPYPFTTKIPQPAMMPYENILIQLIDTPPLTKESSPSWLKAIVKESDVLVVVFDLTKENITRDIRDFKEILDNWRLGDKKIIFLGNKVEEIISSSPAELSRSGSEGGKGRKVPFDFAAARVGKEDKSSSSPFAAARVIDLEIAKENLKKLETQYEIKPISCSQKIGLEELKKEIFYLLEIVRVYTKSRNRPEPDFSHPFIMKKGEKLITLASQIHHDLLPSFKYAKLFKENAKNPQIVGKDYILEDGDIVEIYA